MTNQKTGAGQRASLCALAALGAVPAAAQQALPFPAVPSASVAGPTLQQSRHEWRKQPSHLAPGAPNILIIMLDDVGFAQSDTVGGPIHTPTLARIADTGVTYNAFHTTAVSSATRAALLTGRNHHRVASGQIAELANDWDGYAGVIPKTSATIPEVLKYYGYSTAAFGKWHNTPANQTTAMGPFDRWPTGHGFESFYGFIAGETSQYEPRLYRNTTAIEPPHDKAYHLTEDLASQAVGWLQQHQAYSPQKPFFMYWTPGAVHGPHHVFREWADKYKGKFDAGWDVYRERAFAQQKKLGWIPADARLNARPAGLPAWDTLSPQERQYQARLMEVYAGFLEHADTQAGKVVDELERLGLRENTLIFYVLSDNGASSEGMQGSIDELLVQNGIPSQPAEHMKVLDEQFGGLSALGGAQLDNMYHAAWAQAGSTPFQGTKLMAGHFGGTRTPMAISWPKQIKADGVVRTQFHHVNDIAPTIYEAAHIVPPKTVDGFSQDPFDGVSLAYTFANPKAAPRKHTQYFEFMGARGIYHDGWIASVNGPRLPWSLDLSGYLNWDSSKDQWQLYELEHDYSQAVDVAAAQPKKLAEMKALFEREAKDNKVYPVGGGAFVFLNPSQRLSSGLSEWHFSGVVTRMPEPVAPNIKARDNLVTVAADVPPDASGVLYALGGAGGGIALYVDNGTLVYEYNALILRRTKIRSVEKLPAGPLQIEVETRMASPKRGAPAQIVLRVNGREVGQGTVPLTVPLLFTASETFDVGTDLGSPVSLDYAARAPFSFNGRVMAVDVKYLP
ncbi:MAG: arylsulfatase [Pseudomonadota bacterium]